MKHPFLRASLSAATLAAAACGLSTELTPTALPDTPIPATAAVTQPPASTVTPEVFISLTQAGLSPVEFNGITLSIPAAVAAGASGSVVARLDDADAAYWQKTPGHRQVSLGSYYVLKGKANEPVIYVFPAAGYAELVPAAFESLHRLNNTLNNPASPAAADQLPVVPFFNAAQVIAVQVQPLAFQNGRGLRTVAWYSQGPAPVTDEELFYHFEGLTSDGAYYIVAVMPVTVPVLQADNSPDAAVPAGGVPMPDLNSASPDLKGYYAAVGRALDGLAGDDFTPSLSQLDAMLASLRVVP